MDTIFVVGSNSFSGASFIKHALSQENVKVVGISRSPEPNSVFLPYKWMSNKNFKFYQLDLNHDLHPIADLIYAECPTYVLNFAAQSMVGESWINPGDWFATNTVATIKFHDILRKCKFLKRYIHITTPEVYGNCSGFVKEDFPFNPSTPYAVSRAAADMSLRTFRSAYQFPVIFTRAANVYGPGQQLYRIIPRTILYILLGRRLQLHGGGVSTRSFIHIRDVSDATWKIMKNGRDGDTYHISNNLVISICDLVEMICRKLDVSIEKHVDIVGDRLGKDSSYLLDSSKIRTELGWQDQISLEQGVDECIQWVHDNFKILSEEPFDYIHKP